MPILNPKLPQPGDQVEIFPRAYGYWTEEDILECEKEPVGTVTEHYPPDQDEPGSEWAIAADFYHTLYPDNSILLWPSEEDKRWTRMKMNGHHKATER